MLSLVGGGVAFPQPVQPAAVQGAVHSIDLPVYEPEMPEGPNRNLFLNSCTMCHSGRYVLMQFPLGKAKWTAEVEKMKKAFGCPVDLTQAKKLVEYLTAIRTR